MPQVHELVKELAVFENEPYAVKVTVEELVADGFGETPCFICFVAEYKDTIVGMALLYPRYSTWDGRTVHLEDLIVTRPMRGKGIGDALFKKVVEYGHQQGVRRIEWEVLDWNEGAIRFYERQGARILRDWDVAKMGEKAISDYLKNKN